MTPPTPTHTHIWDGSRTLPDWLTGHRWTAAGQLVIRTPDGDTRPHAGWWLIAWSDGTITVASPTSGERVYGAGGMVDRLARAEAAIARVHAKLDSIADFATSLDTSDTVPYHDAVDSIRATLGARPADDAPSVATLTPDEEARLAQDGIDTPGCDCGHDGMGVSWHSDDCPWRRSVVDCPGRPTPG